MQTKVLLSSTVAMPSIEKAFQLADEHGCSGVELMPFRWTRVDYIEGLAAKHYAAVSGIHFPFRWHTQKLRQEMASETRPLFGLLRLLYWPIFGCGHLSCPAMKLSQAFPKAYRLFHPEVYLQAGKEACYVDGEICFENHRKLGLQPEVWDPEILQNELIELWPKRFLMFDPWHAAISQPKPIPQLFRRLRPAGLHFSFGDNEKIHRLPTPKEWEDLSAVIREQNCLRYLVIEVREVGKARRMIEDTLGI